MRQDLIDWMTLSLLPGIGCSTITGLVDFFSVPGAALAADSRELLGVEFLNSKQRKVLADGSAKKTAQKRAEQELEKATRLNIQAVCLSDATYPELLREIYDPPPVLFLQGDPTLLGSPSVAVIGSRAATDYGRRSAFSLARDLAEMGVAVVSGLALGIDGEAHRGALAASGKTLAVLGCGLDVVYPRQHQNLYQEIGEEGLIVSEYLLGTQPDGFRFPARNRIIAGLSRAVVVVEATAKSGSLITATMALEQGREVFAVPGRIDSPKSSGCHRLLVEGAHPALSADSIVEVVGFCNDQNVQADKEQKQSQPNRASLGQEELAMLQFLDVYPKDIEEIIEKSGRSAAEVSSILLHLELLGHVRQLPGQQYERMG
jgi:DNA processing protein